MAARGKGTRQARTESERARLHTARKTWHEGQIRRRVRDNTTTEAIVIIAGAVASQVAHAQANPPAPEPTPTVAPTDAPLPSETPVPAPLPSETTAP